MLEIRCQECCVKESLTRFTQWAVVHQSPEQPHPLALSFRTESLLPLQAKWSDYLRMTSYKMNGLLYGFA